MSSYTKGTTSFLRKLTWDSFIGNPDAKSEFKAHTYWNITYNYYTTFQPKFKVIVNVSIQLTRKSWVKKNDKSCGLLNHEQGHYTIGVLCALEFKKKVNEFEFSKEFYHEEIKEIFQETLNEYLKFEKDYDDETNHMKNKEEQKKWDDIFKAKMKDLKSYI